MANNLTVSPRLLKSLDSSLIGQVDQGGIWHSARLLGKTVSGCIISEPASSVALVASVRRSLVEASRAFADSTSISAGIDFAMTQLGRAPYETRRRVIDVSGDGDNNSGRDVTAARNEAIANGVTINGLVILTEAPLSLNPLHTNPLGGLANYYRNNVIGGPGAFVMVAKNINSFGDIIVKKLIAEIAQAVPLQRRKIDEAAN